MEEIKKIAVLGWGSLIWDKRTLSVEDEIWEKDGPQLPIEFARISADGRLTLVIHPGSKVVPVLWNIMGCNDLKVATENLKEREGSSDINIIGYVDLTNETNQNGDEGICKSIRVWAKDKDLVAAIWTNLGANFKDKQNEPFSKENIIKYLKSLKLDTEKEAKAKEYIIKAPQQIRTEMREHIEEELGWVKEIEI